MQKQLPDFNVFKKGAGILNVLDHPLRLQLLRYIHQKEKATVTEMYIALRTEQSFISGQLRILRETGFVTSQRQGKNIYYSVVLPRIEKINSRTSHFLKVSSRDYLRELSAFAKANLKNYNVEPFANSVDGFDSWLKAMASALKDYHNSLVKKAAEFTQLAQEHKNADVRFTHTEISGVVRAGIKAFLNNSL